MNRIDLIGHLGNDPKSDVAGNGTAYSHFSLATDEFWRDAQGSLQKKTEWHSVFFWGPPSEKVRLYLRKGAKVRVEGRLESREEGAPGARVKVWSVRGRLFEMLDRKERDVPADQDGDAGKGALPTTRTSLSDSRATLAPSNRKPTRAPRSAVAQPLEERTIPMTPRRLATILPFAALLSLVADAHAASAGMPWETPLNKLIQSLTGPVAKGIGVAAIAIAGLTMALSEGGHAMKTLLRILFGLAIAFTAGTFGLSFMGFSGGFAP